MEEAKWYVIHTYSGYENKVQTGILTAASNRPDDMASKILEVVVPVELIPKEKKSKKSDAETDYTKRKLFPGYVFVKMVMDDDSWYVVRNTRGVTGFVGPGSKPSPLSTKEILDLKLEDAVKASASKKEEIAKIEVDFKEGDSIKVIAGVWKDYIGVVEKLNVRQQTAIIHVELFGRITPVEIAFTDVERYS